MKHIALMCLVAACGTNAPDYIPGFDPPPVQDGYTRYVTPVVKDIGPGADQEWCQWVAPAATEDQDVIAFTGKQSETGHHAVLYATTETSFKTGESHVCTTDDMLSISFVGAIGGEGTASSTLPSGLYFRLRKGQALMANTHWLNTTDKTVDGQAVLDVEFTPADPSHTIADNLANIGDTFSIPPSAPYTYDVTCPIQDDLNLAMIADHMHSMGTSAYTEVIHSDGTKEMLVDDTSWTSDDQFKPNLVYYSQAMPYVLHAGDQMHTHCEWQNTTDQTVLFPTEMCVGTGFYFPGNGELVCDDGSWPTDWTPAN
jgi:Copper type II ascorbate-dependent monooxygenase, C-terminal domain